MDCIYSNPVNYQGNTPSSSIEVFQFTDLNCNITQFATPSASSSTSAELTEYVKNFSEVNTFANLLIIILLALAVGLSWLIRR